MDSSRDFVGTVAQNFRHGRKRFRKNDSDLASSYSGRTSQESVVNSDAWRKPLPPPPPPQQTPKPSSFLPLVSDLNDSQWLEYLEQHGVRDADERRPSPDAQTTASHRSTSISELSRLALGEVHEWPALDNSTADSPRSSTSTMSTMRRRAKTPVFSIDQTDSNSVKRRRWRAASSEDNSCSVELIAEQYRMLLENTIDEEANPSRAPSRHSPHSPETASLSKLGESETDQRRNESSAIQENVQWSLSDPQLSSAAYSPPSDDGTLVAFEEDVIYFKPVSYTPAPSPPLLEAKTYGGAPPQHAAHAPAHDSVSLQICVDLLTRELSTAFAREGKDTSAQQVWVMIEAYERLRSQMAQDDELGISERQNVACIFDSWLASLHTLHKSLVDRTARN